MTNDPLAILRADFQRKPSLVTLLAQGALDPEVVKGSPKLMRAVQREVNTNLKPRRAAVMAEYARTDKICKRMEAVQQWQDTHFPNNSHGERVEYQGQPVTKIMGLLRHLRDTGQLVCPDITSRAMAAHWFDFRAAPTSGDTYVKDFAKEMVEAGHMAMPYPYSVFAFTVKSSTTGALMTVCAAWVLDDNGPWNPWAFYVPHEGAPAMDLGHAEFDDKLRGDQVFEFLGLLDSRAMRAETSDWNRKPMEARHGYAGNAYTVLTLNSRHAEDDDPTGHHASPRLHWRRGHMRLTRSGKIVPVRPHLVGCADRGVIVKDYRAQASALNEAGRDPST